jgi:hypothetical protein
MEYYKNLGGSSGVAAFEVSNDSITVQFKDGSVYLYNYNSTGNRNIEHMKALAVAGQGLNSFIGRFVRKRYAQRLR